MKQVKDKNRVIKIEPVGKSVRTTFTLTQDGIKAMEWIKKHYGITLKNLIDILYKEASPDKTKENQFLRTTIEMSQKLNLDNIKPAVRKTVVISDRAQRGLNKLSKDNQIPRDVLVDRGLIFLEQGLKITEEDRKKAHKKALEIIGTFWSDAEKIEKNLKEFLDSEDPILNRFGLIDTVIMSLHQAIETELKEGTPISPDDFSQSC